MLYRKHHHVAIAKENPGLDNPQLSKLIAKIWNAETDEEKSKWKLRAEDAVKQHAQQYPGYRYKPRRRGQFVEPRNSDGSCSRCGGYPMTPGTAHFRTPTTLPPTPRTHQPHEEPWVRDRLQTSPSYETEKRGQENYTFSSPQAKRRRLPDAAGSRSTASQAGLYSRPPGQLANTPRSGDRYLGTPLPNMTSLMAQGAMPPPPVPHGRGSGPGRGRGGMSDEWVQLPPLQTRIPPSPARALDMRLGYTPTSAIHPSVEDIDMRDQTLMEQIMSIPLEWKLGVVEHVNPHLEKPSVSPSDGESRGAIISIEGLDKNLLAGVEEAVEKALLVTEQTDIKCWVNEYSHIGAFNEDPFKRDPLPAVQEAAPFIFQHIAEWHEKMRYVLKHVHKPVQERRNRATTPVALLKGGYSLTVSDRLAGRTDPSTRFKVVDHWRWMVGLWRGLPGPDLVVYVKPSSAEEIAKSGTVDFQRQLKLILIRVSGDKGTLEESTARRIQFELIEWMREGWIYAETPRP